MSRVGRLPIKIEDKVEVSVSGSVITVKSGKSTEQVTVQPSISVAVKDGYVKLTRENDDPQNRAYHGLYRALIQNAVTGVSKGWNKNLELNGVGYRASVSGKKLELNLGYSHPIQFAVPEGIEIKVDKQTKLSITGSNRELVGQVAAKIRGFREPEPYLGKGIKYDNEIIRRKAGKSASK